MRLGSIPQRARANWACASRPRLASTSPHEMAWVTFDAVGVGECGKLRKYVVDLSFTAAVAPRLRLISDKHGGVCTCWVSRRPSPFPAL